MPRIPDKFQHALMVGMAIVMPFLAMTGQTVRINEISAYSMYIEDESVIPSGDWRMEGYDDSPWPRSVLPIGADQGGYYDLAVNLFGQLNGLASSIYVRKTLSLDSSLANSEASVTLTIDYDDAFVMYINGIEVVRNNVGFKGYPPSYRATARESHPASNDAGMGTDRTETFDLGKASLFFKSGANSVALMIFNESLANSDMFLDLSLRIGDTVITDPGSSWAYFVGIGKPGETAIVSGIESDWIELYNPTDAYVDLEGWSLSDSVDEPAQWTFPAVSIQPKGYLLVFASGQDVRDPATKLETSFKLSSSGEYLGLFDAAGNVVSEFAPEYPEQPSETSYGWSESSGTYQFSMDRTPGAANADSTYIGEASDTSFSVDRGFYDEPFEVEITTELEGAYIRYTLDGSTPTEANGIDYTAPIPITTTTLLRARSFKEDYLPSNVDTHTYIFIEDVITQDNAPEGFPAMLKNTGNNPDIPADYEMDPEVTEDPLYKDKMRDALLSIPSISLVTDIENLYDRNTGLYMNPTQHGELWERPVSIELLYPSGEKGFQVDAGLRIQGGHTRNPTRSPKHSFRVAFRKEYGPGTLDYRMFPEPTATKKFDTIILRAGGNQSWTHHNGFRGDNRGRAQYVRDQFAKDLQGLTASPHLHNRYAFLYLNGVFWGLYNPTERATGGYGEAYFGGDKEDYDALNSGDLLDGNIGAWNVLMSLIDSDLSDPSRYEQVGELLDLTAFADYMQLNHWGGNEDWDDHNWYALRNRLGGKFTFFLWDSEFFFETAGADVTYKNTTHHPGGIFYSLMKNPEFRVLFADRIYHNFFNGGPLTTPTALALWEDRTAQVYQALIAESARWGDNRRDTNRMTGPYELYTRDNQWAKERTRVVETIIPVRNQTTLNQYQRLGWVADIPGPEFSKAKGWLSDTHPLAMTTTAAGNPVIYYTTDGSDPRLTGGAISSQAITYENPITVTKRTTIKARIRTDAGWGPVREADFHPAGDPADLLISEILYAPLDSGEVAGKDLEFIEIMNSGSAAISLDQVELSGGVDFVFPDGMSLDPGEYTIVVSNVSAFSSQGNTASIAGEYSGNLSNDGERVTLRHAELGVIQHVVYDNWYPWPEAAATQGYSLIPVSLGYRGGATHSTAWKAGSTPGGTPGMSEAVNAGWLEHDSLGWVYSNTGDISPGSWLYSLNGKFLYVGSDDPVGNWIWFMK